MPLSVPTDSSFVGLTPGRLFETRAGESTVDGQQNGVGRCSAGQVSEVQVAGRANVPVNASAAVLNIAAITPSADGFMTLFPCGVTRPGSSTLNYASGAVVAYGATVKLGVGGKICIFSQQAMDLIVDVTDYFPQDTAQVLPFEICTTLTQSFPGGSTRTQDRLFVSTNGTTWEWFYTNQSDGFCDAATMLTTPYGGVVAASLAAAEQACVLKLSTFPDGPGTVKFATHVDESSYNPPFSRANMYECRYGDGGGI